MKILDLGDTALVPVYHEGRFYDFAWIDAVDIGSVSGPRRWTRATGGYAISSAGLMHRLILDMQKGQGIAHHRNEDTLDNRRENLLVCADKLEHGFQPHPRRNAKCSRDGRALPLLPREVLIRDLAAAGGLGEPGGFSGGWAGANSRPGSPNPTMRTVS